MKISMIYDHQPQNKLFPYSGLQVDGWIFAKELRKLGHEVTEYNMFTYAGNVGDADVVMPVGFWGDLQYLKPTNKPVVPYMTTDGQIPKKYVDMINGFAHWITQSESCRKVSIRDGIKEDKISVVYPSPDIEVFKPLKRPEHYPPIILTNFMHGGDRELIEAVPTALGKGARFTLILKIHHKVTKEHKKWVDPLRERLGIENNVVWMDVQVTNSDMPKFYQYSDLYVSLGGIIGFELPFQEANACGVPVIGLNYGAVPEFIAEGYNGFMIPVIRKESYKTTKAGIELTEESPIGDAKVAGEKMAQLLVDKELWYKMSENSRKQVEGKFNSEVQGKEMSRILEKVI